MSSPRERHIEEIKQLHAALAKTKSPCAMRDLEKAIMRKLKELKTYDRIKGGGEKCL